MNRRRSLYTEMSIANMQTFQENYIPVACRAVWSDDINFTENAHRCINAAEKVAIACYRQAGF